MLNFNSILKYISSNWDPDGDFNSLVEMESLGERYVIVIKKSIWYGVFASFLLFGVIGILIINLWIISFSVSFGATIKIILIVLLAWNILYGIYSLIYYLRVFTKVYGSHSKISNIYIGLAKLKAGDVIFTKFVNQSFLNIILLLSISIFSIFTLFSSLDKGNMWWTGINILLFIVQIFLSYTVLHKLINLEMDYFLVSKNTVILNQQEGIFSSNGKTIGTHQIRTIDNASKGLFSSIFNYGFLIIETIGGGNQDKDSLAPKLSFISNPKPTSKICNRITKDKISEIEEADNLYLAKLLYEGGFLEHKFVLNGNLDLENPIDSIKHSDIGDKVIDYINNNEDKIKEDFETGDDNQKDDIRNIYTRIIQKIK